MVFDDEEKEEVCPKWGAGTSIPWLHPGWLQMGSSDLS